ncbi:MAG: PPP family 3-phenylpropionic acid transporter [Myxococcota bacterium]
MRTRLYTWYMVSVGALGGLPMLAPSLSDAGLSDAAIASAFLLFPLSKLVVAPAWAWVADRSGRTVWALALTAAVAAVGGIWLALAVSPTALVAGLGLLALGHAALFPLGDSLTVGLLGEDRRDYGRIRAAGSVAFIVVVLAVGQLSATWSSAPRVAIAVLLAATVVASLRLPDAAGVRTTPSLGRLVHTARSTGLVPLLAVVGLHGTTLAIYDRLFALHTTRLDVSSGWTAVSIGVGVAVEVGVLWYGRSLLDRVSPARALTIAAGVGVIRFGVTAVGPVWAVLVVQAAHGLSYALFWVAAVALFSERAPRELAASVQTLLVMSMFGVGPLVAMGAGVVLLPRVGTAGLFVVAAAVAGLATLGAVAVERRDRFTSS